MSLFGTAGIRGSCETDVTPELAVRLGVAFGQTGSPVLIGRDGRRSGSALADAVSSGVQAAGGRAIRVGQLPTPALAHASRGRRGIMVTASHNPPADNGLKFFVDGAAIDAEMEQSIEERMAGDVGPTEWADWGTASSGDVLASYRSTVIDALTDRFGPTPLQNLAIVIDCGGGMGALVAPSVLDALGGDVVSLNGSVDGTFSARASKPTEASLEDCRSFLRDGEAQLGFALDGDADRLVVLDGDGAIRHEDTILAALGREYVADSSHPDPVVLTTPNASRRVEEVVTRAGGTVEYVSLGGLTVGLAEHSPGDGPIVFAGEPWKHLHPTVGPWMDGIVSAGVIAGLVAREGSIESLCTDIPEYSYSKEAVACPDQAKSAVMESLPASFDAQYPDATIRRAHGIRVEFDGVSWTLIRPSGTEPYIRVYAEGDIVGDLEGILTLVAGAVDEASETT